MFKRFARLRVLSLLGGLLLTTACTASNNSAQAPYTESKEYVTLPGPAHRYNADGKVEVVEVFSYGCIHCAHFAPIAEAMSKQLPGGVELKMLPAAFNDDWAMYARAYYAAKKLGLLGQTHLALFKAKFEDHYPLSSLDELADFYAQKGADRAQFMRVASSDEVTAQIKSDVALIKEWGITGTPTIVVDGKYRSETVQSLDQMSALAQWLAKRELSGK
ncbi:thiol:disulfide interchange protein DsbA/DsbL [Dyella tabacisoli]|uniref:Thiol:disulfide interchange protein n=1 Tax=Dyella tabacisoli TaxID=2282381 RepID=A0A369UM22_9GAMM|nr:thiol:disulfide interchange protein DsbA/DsbL [Dyella tabacisoli]RDD80758.1 thiol:disulfide interchange protein DsbA/DsbL [Dyella tabacisoli]